MNDKQANLMVDITRDLSVCVYNTIENVKWYGTIEEVMAEIEPLMKRCILGR